MVVQRSGPRGRSAGPKELTKQDAKATVLDLVGMGSSINDALAKVGRGRSTYELWRRDDKVFAGQMDAIRTAKGITTAPDRVVAAGTFEEFRTNFLHSETFPHQLQWIDILEGNDPRDLHPSMTYEPVIDTYGDEQPLRFVINTPPEHAKSTTVTEDYVTYRICKDPNIRVVVISKSQQFARKFLYAIKDRLSNPQYSKLIATFAPEGGFKGNSDAWTADMFYIGGRTTGEKDPTVQALGLGGQIYGARADLIIVDDAVVLANAHEWEKQLLWLRQEVDSRLGVEGVCLVIGTRVAAVDLYREIRNPAHYSDGFSPWTYFAQPAVLVESEDPHDWVTLWPLSDKPSARRDVADENGHYPRWTGPRLAVKRNSIGINGWAMVYQQQDVEEDAVFNAVCVQGSTEGRRKPGPLVQHAPGHPDNGGLGHVVICSMDPAMTGDTGSIAYSVDPQTGMRYLLEAERMQHPTPAKIKARIFEWTEKYNPREWVIEKNAFQLYLTQDEAIREYLAIRGIVLREHYTGRNKWDADFGVASMAPLFGDLRKDVQGINRHVDGSNKIQLNDPRNAEGTRALIEQLVTWSPDTRNKTDMVMALWFAEIRAREVVRVTGRGGNQHFINNPFLSEREKNRRVVINLSDYAERSPLVGYL